MHDVWFVLLTIAVFAFLALLREGAESYECDEPGGLPVPS